VNLDPNQKLACETRMEIDVKWTLQVNTWDKPSNNSASRKLRFKTDSFGLLVVCSDIWNAIHLHVLLYQLEFHEEICIL
jgi:hypothetical protein